MTVPGASGAAAWRPAAPLDHLRRRAELAAATRAFFQRRDVLEVETPILARETTPETHLTSFEARDPALPGLEAPPWFLQTSPELHMKRLLAAGSGPIFQLARVARGGERGRLHNPEFTLLEWYQPGWDHHRLMDEVEELLAELVPSALPTDGIPRRTYRELFADYLPPNLCFDPLTADVGLLDQAVATAGIAAPEFAPEDRDGRLALLLTHVVEPRLPAGPLFVHSFPASQASLARVVVGEDGVPWAERFELYLDGVELANGFHELTDAAEQRRRFEDAAVERRSLGLPAVPSPERFLAALDAGLPASAGVALGFDRLVMRALAAHHIDQVVAFPEDRA